ncbi:MAG: pilus assembly protein, partial [Lachnospiraceae bacterium]|nr:pilus assembly protein [Lachnospiraceae bacterium]
VLMSLSSYHVPFNIFGLSDFNYRLRVAARKWTGYDINEESDDEEIVYVAKNGIVYHRSPNCTHINLDIHVVSGASLDSCRNEDGCKYYPCERCMKKKKMPSVVFITSWGTCAHSSKDCSGLKRSVRAVPISQVGGLGPCSKCSR